MEDIKVTVLRLSGCGWCGTVCEKLDDLGVEYESLDANEEGSSLADRLEGLLDTTLYPILIVEGRTSAWYVYRPINDEEVDKAISLGFNIYKIGCDNITDLVDTVYQLVNLKS